MNEVILEQGSEVRKKQAVSKEDTGIGGKMKTSGYHFMKIMINCIKC
jgi:hypothetical protein